MNEYSFIDDELGIISVCPNPKSRYRIVMRAVDGGIRVTCPLRSTRNDVLNAIDKSRSSLLKLKNRKTRETVIDASFGIQTDCFSLHLEPIRSENYQIRVKMGEAVLFCPQGETFAPERQKWLREAILNVVRAEAKLFLPKMLHELAEKHGFIYSGVTIKANRSNWGSCSARKHINLSLYLMLLPKHLIEYVLLHELCHTVEMNHGARFWALLDKCIGGNSKAVRNELKSFHTAL